MCIVWLLFSDKLFEKLLLVQTSWRHFLFWKDSVQIRGPLYQCHAEWYTFFCLLSYCISIVSFLLRSCLLKQGQWWLMRSYSCIRCKVLCVTGHSSPIYFLCIQSQTVLESTKKCSKEWRGLPVHKCHYTHKHLTFLQLVSWNTVVWVNWFPFIYIETACNRYFTQLMLRPNHKESTRNYFQI